MSAPTDPSSTTANANGQTPSPRTASGTGASPAYRVTQPRRAAPKRAVERSCIVCHRRKVKCDKTMPCANCVRSGVLCCYPSNKRAPRQPKTTIADIASRLVQLERTIVAVAGGDNVDGGGDDNGEDSDTAPSQARMTTQRPTNGHAHTGSLGAALERRAANRAPTSISTVLGNNHGDETRSSGTPGGGEDDTSSSQDGTQSENGAAAQEILVQNAYASRYINELLLSKILEEEEEFRSALASPKEGDAEDSLDHGAAHTSAPAFTLFGMVTSSGHVPVPWTPPTQSSRNSSNAAFHPPKRHAMQLWQEFLHSVEPMNKVLHVPTAEVGVFTAIQNPEKTEPAFESLLFSIYYAAVTVYQPEAYRAAFGEDKGVALDRYRAGMERALVKARFLESPSLPTLQALTLFLRTSRAHSPGQSIWILYGMVLRLAQSIGLHRDGANFNLSPFESEIRRRVWGHMIKQDDRAAEDHGIDISLTDTDVDCQEALNLNDRDIHPDMTSLPVPQMRFTEMTLPVCIRRLGITMAYMMRLLTEMKATQNGGGSSSARLARDLPLTEDRRQAIMADRNAYVEELLLQCNMVVPVQRATYKMVRLIQLKMDFVTRLQLAAILAAGMKSEADRHRAIANEDHLRLACEVIEINVDIMEDELIQDYRWTAEIYPQYHTLLYVLWHLCVQPVPASNAALRDRAWAVAEGMYAMEDARQKRQNVRGRNSKWAVLMALREKALRVRSALDAAAKGSAPTASAATTIAPDKADGDVHMDDGSKPATPVTSISNTETVPPPYSSVMPQPVTLPSAAAMPASMSVPTQQAAPTTNISVGPPYGAEYAEADMTEFLGDSALGLGMDMEWVRGFMDWNAVADDFRMRTYDAGT